MTNNPKYTVVAENALCTVVSDYIPDMRRDAGYQSEAELEKSFIEQLKLQAYEYLPITTEVDLIQNLRKQLEKLNTITFSDAEWTQFFVSEIANPNHTPKEKAITIHEDHVKVLTRDDGSKKNIYLLNKESVHENSLQVINQYVADDGQRPNRYDVTILVNGLPLVHIELKKRGVALREAFNQINRYQRESFWSNTGLFEYIQIFVISNGTHTKYYSTTVRDEHVRSNSASSKKGKHGNNSFEFTNWWADEKNNPISELVDFTKTFFAKHTLLNILLKYCVLTVDRQLLVMRPYQIVATEKILNRIMIATNYKKQGTIDAGGYIWHTTGSGKTLTSFKTAQIASRLPYIDKVLFVVDRKDLDYQTMCEYDKFSKGAANSNHSTTILEKQLRDTTSATRIIVTTIQKLSRFISRYQGHSVLTGNVVLIFDECHRSQFGDMHNAVTKAFKNYYIFGFTGTPIFAVNANSNAAPTLRTTEQAFGDKLHSYTIVNAIADKNVLRFKIDHYSTMRISEDVVDEKVEDIDREAALLAPERISGIVAYILKHFNQKTCRTSLYQNSSARSSGFNSIFATASIDAAKKYYTEFKKQLALLPDSQKLKIALIYSFSANEAEFDGMHDENPDDTSGLDQSSRDFLDSAIGDYNAMYGTPYDTSPAGFQGYYKDVSKRVKNREVDILIVVNMFLTGFDATTLNTLWVDKNLRLHGLMQAFSRTNRILNSVKTHGNIVCFRNLHEATEEALALFGDKEAGGVVLLKTYNEYYNGYMDGDKHVRGYVDLIKELREKYPIGKSIDGEKAQKDFIQLYGAILRLQNILASFDEFQGQEILTIRESQDYHSIYIDLYNEFRSVSKGVKENINDDLVFEIELVKRVEINIDYILSLVLRYHAEQTQNKEILVDIAKAINASMELRNKKELIMDFINSLTATSNPEAEWPVYVTKNKHAELQTIIAEENLNAEATLTYMRHVFQLGKISSTGTAIAAILPPVSRFSSDGERSQKKERVAELLTNFFTRYYDISTGDF